MCKTIILGCGFSIVREACRIPTTEVLNHCHAELPSCGRSRRDHRDGVNARSKKGLTRNEATRDHGGCSYALIAPGFGRA